MILFLDFDGVTHPVDDSEMHFSRTPHLWDLLRRQLDVSVVFSTGWRFTHELADLVAYATEDGGEDLANRFIDMTPTIRRSEAEEPRSRELDCFAWLRSKKMERQPWLALDDTPSLFSQSARHLYSVNPKTGIMYYDVELIIKRMRGLAP